MSSKLPAILVLADGTKFRGTSIGIKGSVVGEIVFNTAMTGYQEILSDPSYTEQIITFTYPHIGNTGINLEWKDGYAGETLFYNDDLKDAHTVSSFVPGRITIFDGEIPHTIRPQSTYGPDYRFTISYFVNKE